MRHLMVVFGSCAASFFLMGAGAIRTPFHVIYENGQASFQSKIFSENGVSIVRDEGSLDQEFDHLYVVRMPHHKNIPLFAETLGEVLHFEPNQFSIMRMTDLRHVEELSHHMHHEGIACGALFRLYGDDTNQTEEFTAAEPITPVTQDIGFVKKVAATIDPEAIRASIAKMGTFPTRFHSGPNGKATSEWLKSQYEELKGPRTDITVELIDHVTKTKQNSVVVRILGTKKPEELIVLGSHIDSVNWQGSGPAPGADDNASGTSTNLEVFRRLMAVNYRPERTVEIHGYAAEEIGLVGSQDLAKKYKAAGRQVITMVQFDMNLYKAQGQPDKIWFVTNNTVESFNRSLGALIDRYIGLTWDMRSLSGGDSDHTSWRRQGYVTSFPFENPGSYNKNIHTSRDALGPDSALTQAAAFGKLAVAYFAHYAGVTTP